MKKQLLFPSLVILCLFLTVESSAQESLQRKLPVVQAEGTCTDMGVENGWSAWQAYTGDHEFPTGIVTYNTGTQAPASLPNGGGGGPRFAITGGANIDPCTPGGGGPALPTIAPGFGNSSIQLGEPQINGGTGGCNRGCVEKLTFDLTVTSADTNFLYAYAIVIENPATPAHTLAESPFAEIYILDNSVPRVIPGKDTVPYSHRIDRGDISGGVPPGMYKAACAGVSNNVTYKPWTFMGISLQKYIGSTVTVVLVNADCSQGGHFCHSYWDFKCGGIASGIGKSEELSFISVFPSPVAQNLFLDFSNHNFGEAEVFLNDVTGRTLFSKTITGSGKQTLDVSDFSNGIYFMKLKTDYGVATKKIVIAR